MRNIFAYTDNSSPYPGYVSLNLKETGQLVLTVREAVEGKQLINLDMPEEEILRLITSLGMYMTSKLPHRTEKQLQESIDLEVQARTKANVGIPMEMAIMRSALKQDPDYLWSWHCNLVQAFQDAGCPRKEAMNGSARFIYNLAQVDVTEHPNFKEDLSRLEQ